MPGNALVQSLARGLDLVRLLAESDSGLGMQDLIQATGLKRPTVYNLLRTLSSRDFVRKEGNRFRVGSALHEMSAQDTSSRFLELAEEGTCMLADRLPDAIVSYSEPVGSEMVVRFRKFPERVLMERNSGALMPPYQTAYGLAHLAYADPEAREAIQLRYPFEVGAGSFWRSEAELEKFLAGIRRDGYVGPEFNRDSRFMRVAVPSIAPSGCFVGAYGAAWQAGTVSAEDQIAEVVPVLGDVAARLAEQTVSGRE